MQEIDREQAEWLVASHNVLNRQLKQTSEELTIFLTLANHQVCVVTYHLDTCVKSYFIHTPNEN